MAVIKAILIPSTVMSKQSTAWHELSSLYKIFAYKRQFDNNGREIIDFFPDDHYRSTSVACSRACMRICTQSMYTYQQNAFS